MTPEEFRKHAHDMVDWVADYLENVENYPVKSPSSPGDILKQIPVSPPSASEPMESIRHDLDSIIMKGITHWQHPNFHAYFNANNSYPSILAEIVMSGIGAQCMIWETSPAAAELEEAMMNWLKQMLHLPEHWSGVIQDTGSTATLSALLTAREKRTNLQSNKSGIGNRKFRIYCSDETHSSIEKAVRIMGVGSENLVKIDTDELGAMRTESLSEAIEKDLKNGLEPFAVVSTMGTTGTLAFDPVEQVSEICTKHQLWHHVDAAYAGTALVLEEYRHLSEQLVQVDSFMFNPHKWMFTNFDCSAYFVRDKEALIQTFEILPEYLKTGTRNVNNYKDWGIPLGRRFRALKLWFVIREFGVTGIQEKIKHHIELAKWFENQVVAHPKLELVVPRSINVVIFRFNDKQPGIDLQNERLLQLINESGKAYLTHTRIQDKYVLRMTCGQTNVEKRHMESLWGLILEKMEML